MESKTRKQLIVAAVIIVVAVSWRIYSDSNKKVTVAKKANPVTEQKSSMSKRSERPVKDLHEPEYGNVPKSIEILARDIVEGAPNKVEAFAFLVEARSYRIQEMRKLRNKAAAESAKAAYDTELWTKKQSGIEAELNKDEEEKSISTQRGGTVGHPNRSRYVESGIEQNVGVKSNPKKSLNDFVLRALILQGDEYVARLSYQQQRMSAKKGYKLLGDIDVTDVAADSITLTLDDKTLTLYAN